MTMMRAGLRQAARAAAPRVGMLYFHPWEFDAEQPRLPLSRLARWRTYVGVARTTGRLARLLAEFPFRRAVDVARQIRESKIELPRFKLADDEPGGLADGEPPLGRLACTKAP